MYIQFEEGLVKVVLKVMPAGQNSKRHNGRNWVVSRSQGRGCCETNMDIGKYQ